MSTLRTSNLIHGSSAVSNVVLDTQGRASFGPDGPNGRAALYVNPQNNRVGVNNESPSTTLDVDGAINTTGNLTVGGTLNLTGALTSDVINAGSGTAAAPSVSVGTTDNGLYSPGTDQVAISTNGTERMQIDSSGNVGIGRTSPAQNLDVASSSNIAYALDGWALAGKGDSSDILFGGILGSQFDTLKLFTSGSERLRIDSSGNVGIASTSPDAELHIGGSEPHIDIGPDSGNRAKIGFKSTDIYIGTTSGSGQTIFKNNVTSTDNPADSGTERMRITSDGNVTVGGNTDGATPAWSSVRTAVRIDGAQPILYLNETDVATGSAGSYLGAASTNLYLGNAGGSLIFQTSPPDGSTIERGRFLSTGGLTFNGDTATANALDDYEEGNFNASVTGSTSAGTATYQYALGDYTKVGRMVHVRIYIAWTGHTGTGGLYIRGLPYNIVNYAAYGGPSVNYWNQMNPGPCNGISALWGIGSDYVYFYTNSVSGGAAASVLVQPLGSIIICGSYYVA